MRVYRGDITLVKNKRGCYLLDTIKGCSVCRNIKPKGCYDDCYAKNIADRYGFDFSKPIIRMFKKETEQLFLFDFYNSDHEISILNDIKNIDMPFIRIGEMGDPSEDWEHTISICKKIYSAGKPIVIVTKHWKQIPKNLLSDLIKLNICINTSISALDNNDEIKHRLKQYKLLKKYCNSILRVVSCNFNKNNKTGYLKSVIQEKLFDNDNVIDTVFRPGNNNKLIKENIIKTEKVKFLNSYVSVSMFNKNTYFGTCNKCPDMCGINFYKTP